MSDKQIDGVSRSVIVAASIGGIAIIAVAVLGLLLTPGIGS